MSDTSSPTPSSSLNSDEEVAFTLPDDVDAKMPESVGIIPMMGGIEETALAKLFEARVEELGRSTFINNANTPGSYDNLLFFALQNQQSEPDRIQDAVAMLSDLDKVKFGSTLSTPDGKIVLGPMNFAQQKGSGEAVTGERGIVQMLASRKGKIRRIPLYNSGFSIDVRVPNLDNLSTLLRACKIETNEYGRSFGAHFYLYFDLLLKHHFTEMLIDLVVNSTYTEHLKQGALLRRIKLPDFNAILTSVASLMYPEGYADFKHICTRPHTPSHPNGCDHVETLTVDVTTLMKTNFNSLNSDAVAHMTKARTSRVTNDELDAYQAALGFDGRTITFDGFCFHLIVPSLGDYLEAGELFNKDVLNEIQANNTKGIYQAIAFREMRTFVPWISRVDSLEDDGKTVRLSTVDKIVISHILDDVMNNDDYRDGILQKMLDYVNASQLTHICYPTFTCPACGYQPQTKTGFFTVDPQNTFFTLAFRRLTRSSLTPSAAPSV